MSLRILWHPLILDLHIQKIRPEVPAFSLNQIGKGTVQHYSGIGQFVNHQTCTGLRQHGCRLLLVTEPETVDPGHRSMLCKDSNPLDSEVKDACSIPFNQGRNINNNDSRSTGKHESLQSDLHSLALCRRICTGPKSSLNY